MPKFDLNPEQKLARDIRNRSVLVSAAAGSGKTRVLTERLIEAMRDKEHKVDLDRFLVITYTRAAAAELKSRITEALGEELNTYPNDKHLLKQMALSRKAHIQTIHGFCADVLREYGHMLGISPDFKIVEDDRAQMMKTSALAEVIEEYYAAPEAHPGFSDLVSTLYKNRKDDDLSSSVLSAYEKMQSHAFPMEWANQQLDMLSAPKTDAADTVWGREIINDALVKANYWRALTGYYIDLIENHGDDVDWNGSLRKTYMETLTKLYGVFDGIIRANESGTDVWNTIVGLVRPEFINLKSLKKDDNKELGVKIKNMIDAARKAVGKLAETFASPSETLLKELAGTTPAVKALVDLVSDFSDRFDEEKRRLGVLDYSDLEHYAVRLLVSTEGKPTATAVEISKRFTEIMVDEYQDVSEVQNDIISAVSQNGSNLFMVGDVKQSIYSFRLAKPQIFTDRCRAFTTFTPADDPSVLKPGENVSIFMNGNYRSRQEVINGANAVFECCMSSAVGDVDYTGGEKLKFKADYYEGAVPVPEFLLIDKNSFTGAGMNNARIEAETVAAEIRRLVDEGTNPGDIAILLRSVKTLGDAFAVALRKQGIPVSTDGSSDFFESDEILAITSLLSIIDNPHKDIDILSVLRYPAFGFTPDELAQLRKADRKGNLHAALNAYASVSQKAKDFLQMLGRFRAIASELPVSELIWTVMNETDFLHVSCAMPGGEIRRSNLLQLAAMAENFDASGSEGLHKFLIRVKKLRTGKNETGFSGSAGDGVKIMTIHKSKGLEFPVVFVAGMGKRFNSKDSSEPVLVHSDLGFGVKLVDREQHTACPTLCRNAIKKRMTRERISEEMRVLYVALTRAKERLFLSGIMGDTDKLEDYEKILSRPDTVTNGALHPCMAGDKETCLPWLIYTAMLESMNGNRRMTMRTVKMQDSFTDENSAEEKPEEADVPPEEIEDFPKELLEKLEERFSFCYPFAEAEDIPSKITATAVKDPFAEYDENDPNEAIPLSFARPAETCDFRLPKLDGGEPPIGAAEIGTATHAVLQYIDFAKTGSLAEIEAEIARLQEKGCITARQAGAVNRQMIINFFASETGKRILNAADRAKREFRFSVLTPPEQLGFAPGGDPVLLQGVADCCIIDPDGLVIIDYKTDRILCDEDLEEKTQKYTTQLRVYAGALSRIFRLPVKECALFFLSRAIERKINL